MQAIKNIALLLWPALLLQACGSGGVQEPLFPLQAGQRWTYRVETLVDDTEAKPKRETLTLETRRPTEVLGQMAWHRRSNSGVDYWLRSDETGVYRVASKGPLDHEPIKDPAPRYVLRKPYQVGTSWEAPTTLYVLARRNEFPPELKHFEKFQRLNMIYRIEAIDQEVNTPAANYKGCVLVEGRTVIKLFSDATLSMEDVNIITRESYCPGVGLVRLHREETSPTKFIQGGQYLMELTRHSGS
jgi:hypothetical protein